MSAAYTQVFMLNHHDIQDVGGVKESKGENNENENNKDSASLLFFVQELKATQTW